MLFPMYVVRVDSFLAMREARPHQVLRVEGLACELNPREGAVVVFVSHEWCARWHPDPHFRQLSILQKLFRRAAAGRLLVELDLLSTAAYGAKATVRPADFQDCLNWLMWYDYFSVPQPESEDPAFRVTSSELTQAIFSLHAYVALSNYFLVLAPVVKHESGHMVNYRSWKSRGWCRFERLAYVLSSPDGLTVLRCECEDLLIEMGTHDFLFEPVGRGDFTDDNDRERLALPASQLVESRLRSLFESGDMRGFIRLMSWSQRLMDGLSTQMPDVRDTDQRQADRGSAEGFLRMMRLEKPATRVQGTWPLLLATRMGNLGAMKDLLHCKADVACKEARDDARFRVFTGQSAVHIAADSGHVAALELLVEHRAEVNAQCRFGLTPMHLIGFGGAGACAEVGELLLKRRADINRPNLFQARPLQFAATYDRAEAVEFLLTHGAAVDISDDGQNPLHGATMFGARPELVSMLLEWGVSPHYPANVKIGTPVWLVVSFLCLNYRLGRRGFNTLCCYHLCGSTPLMTAAMGVDIEAAKMLLRARADPDARNIRGATASTLAEMFGSLKGMSSDVGRFFDKRALDTSDDV